MEVPKIKQLHCITGKWPLGAGSSTDPYAYSSYFCSTVQQPERCHDGCLIAARATPVETRFSPPPNSPAPLHSSLQYHLCYTTESRRKYLRRPTTQPDNITPIMPDRPRRSTPSSRLIRPFSPSKPSSLCLRVQTNQPRPHPKVVPRRTHLSAFWPTSSVTHPRPSPFPPINAATSSPTRPQRLSSALNLPPLASFVAP
jgi:hypothetical protein